MWLERCDVSRLIQNTITVLEPLWKKKGVKIVYESSDISGISEIYLDSYWFSQAFENVLKNAVEHTTSGSAVTIQASDRVHRLVLEVKDEGPGIGEDELPYLWEDRVRDRAEHGGRYPKGAPRQHTGGKQKRRRGMLPAGGAHPGGQKTLRAAEK